MQQEAASSQKVSTRTKMNLSAFKKESFKLIHKIKLLKYTPCLLFQHHIVDTNSNLYIFLKVFNRVPCYLVEFNPFSSPDNLGVCPGLFWPPWIDENRRNTKTISIHAGEFSKNSLFKQQKLNHIITAKKVSAFRKFSRVHKRKIN